VSDPIELGGAALGGAVALKAFDFVVARFFGRVAKADEAEAKAVEGLSKKLDEVLAELHALKTELAGDRERAAAVQAAVSKVEARIDGISANHGPRLGSAEQELAAVKARLDSLERTRTKGRGR